jgi:S-DNA-T family DNA segregation ATPase FtsK/SpoIIIE
LRIEAPIPGKSLVGIEVPNNKKAMVGLGSLLGDNEFQTDKKPLLVALGRDIAGSAYFANIAKMPHLLVAGATGSGKSVAIHALITSLLYRNGPATLRFIMIDPKRVELTLYNSIPHLLTPVITDPKKAILSLKWAAKEMERRYNILQEQSVRDIHSYHENVVAKWKGSEGGAPDQMPYIVVIIDELADIMQTYPRELEAAVVRLAQMSRAVGIHLVLSTQRPSVNVITGLIKANVPARVALQVANQFDSRTILDTTGAEKLLGAGDMLYQAAEMPKPKRMQTAFISENEVKTIVDYIRKNNEASLDGIALTGTASDTPNAIFSASLEDDEADDDLFAEAKQIVEEAGKASTSYLQRKLRIGYARAARLMDILEEKGVIGPADGARPRDVLTGNGGSGASDDGAQ